MQNNSIISFVPIEKTALIMPEFLNAGVIPELLQIFNQDPSPKTDALQYEVASTLTNVAFMPTGGEILIRHVNFEFLRKVQHANTSQFSVVLKF